LSLEGGSTLPTDYIISALPAHTLATITPSDLSALLREIEYNSVALVNIGFESRVIPEKLQGFGYLNPLRENQKVLGTTFDSLVFPTQSTGYQTRVTVMIGGAATDITDLSSDELLQIALEELKKRVGIETSPCATSVQKNMHAIPQFYIAHKYLAQRIRQTCKTVYSNKVHLIGNYFEGVGINSCITGAKKLVDTIDLK